MTTFAPHPYVKNVAAAIDFYRAAFGAVELDRKSNPDGSVHVVEMAIGGALFHLHEERVDAGQVSPETAGATTSQMGCSPTTRMRCSMPRLPWPISVSPMQDYDYGYRQGT